MGGKPPDLVGLLDVPRELRDALKVRAAGEDRSVAALLRRAARQYLEHKELQP